MSPEDANALVTQINALPDLPITATHPSGAPDAPTAFDVERHVRHRMMTYGHVLRALVLDAKLVESAARPGLVDVKAIRAELWWWRVGLAGLGGVGLALAALALVIAMAGAVLRGG